MVRPAGDVAQEEVEGEKRGEKEEEEEEELLHQHLQIETSGKFGLGQGQKAVPGATPGAMTRGSFPLNVGGRHI